MAKARQQYFADELSIAKDSREFAITPEILEKINSIEPGAQVNVIETVKVNGEALTPDENKAVDIDVPLVDDTLYSTSSEDALSARQGRILYDYIQNIQSRGRFLSNWNCVTGLATTNPADNPYTYRTGDYYLVGNVAALGGTNYRPDGSQYIINQASTTVESQTVKVGDMYIYDGTYWILLVNTEREIAVDSSLSTTSTNPVENRVVTNALNGKQDTISDLAAIRAGAALGDTALQPGDSLSQLTGTSDDITEGSTNLFMTTAERSKLSNQSGVNTGDETQTTIKNKLGQASTSTDGYLTSTDWNTFNGKQDTISDLATIRSNASAGKSASDTIATYGDIVTHNVNEFATAAQGGLADTAVQPGDNVSTLTNDAGYVTDAYHDSTKQDVLVAGNNIQIAADGVTISATDTTYVASDFDIKDLSDSTGLRTEWSGKQDELIAGTNIQIAADGKTISATDTTYSAGVNVSISNNNVISATDNKAVWGNITGTLSDQTDLNTALSGKQDTLVAGANIQIAADGKTISATDTTYTAGTGIDITNGVISNTQTSAEWGNITGTLSDQTDLQSALDAKQDDMVVLSYGNSTWQDFLDAYNKNAIVYCKASSQSNPGSGNQTRMAFMAFVDINATTGDIQGVEFQYYRSRNDHNTAANQLDEVYVYKLVPASGGTWSVTQRNTAAKATAGTGINLTYGSGNMTIANTGVTSINSQTGDVTLTIPTVPTNVSDFVNDAGYITANDLPTVDTSMSDSSTNAVQNKVIKSYVDTQVQEATAGAVSDTAYGSSWDGITGIAPSKNAVYDKISAMDTTIAGKQNTISDLATIRTGAGKGATAVQPGDNVSTLTNDAGFITKAVNDLTNYYTKSETYTKAEVADYVANFAGFKVVATLPTTDIKTTIIYLLGPVGTGADKYEEYIYSNNSWVMIGETSVDLTNYFNTSTDNSDSITQGSTNLFLTSAERTKLSNTSGTNTGDETKNRLQSKLGAASSSNSGYLTSTDWSTFNSKQNALSSSNAGENIEINNGVISATNAYIITDSDVTITTTDEYGVAPYNASYYYTNIEISANAGIKWIEGAVYEFDCSTTWVASAYRNARIRIGSSGDWKPVMLANNTIAGAHSYLTSTTTRLFVYKTTMQSGGALHALQDTTYSALTVAYITGNNTSQRTVSGSIFNQGVNELAIVKDKAGGQTITNTDTSSTTPLSLTSSASSSYIAFNGSGGYLGSYGVKNDKTPQFYNGASHTLAYISGAQFGSSWDGVADTAPSQNAVYDKISAMDTTISGKADATDLNTKTFYLSGTGSSATVLAEAQEILDWYLAGKHPIVRINEYTFDIYDYYDGKLEYQYSDGKQSAASGGGKVLGNLNTLTLSVSSGAVTSVSLTSATQSAYLSTDNTSTYTPSGDYNPATKKYVDDGLGNKLDKITGTASLDRAYIVDASGTQTTYNVSQGASNGAIVRRSGTQIIVPETPTDNSHATSKKYVDDGLSGKQATLSTQTAYTSKGTATKVPTITTNTLGQVTAITETNITFPVTSVNGQTGAVTGLQTTSNLKTSLSDNSDSYYPSQKAVKTAVDGKQATLVSGTNIKTVNGNSLLGSGDITIQSGGIQNDTTGTTSTVTKIRAGTETEYANLSNKNTSTIYFTF